MKCLTVSDSTDVFTNIDLKPGFHQIRMHPDDIENTAFTTKYGQFEYTAMVMGLCNAHANFRTLMKSIFHALIDAFVVIYLDETLIFSRNSEENHKHVRETLRRLKEN